MSTLSVVTLTGTTDGSGDVTVNGESQINGLLYAIEWVFGSGTAGVDFTLTMQTTPSGVAQTVFTATNANANATYYPREAEVGNTGTALGTYCYPKIVGVPRCVIAQGGATKTYTLVLYYFK